MTNKNGFPIATAIAAAIAVAMLIFLFTVPGNYLRDMTAKLRVMTHEAEQAAVLGDMATAAERLDAITREYNSRRDKIKMFFHHDDLDEMDKTLITCRDLVAMGQSDNLICEIDTILGILDHMDAVETITIAELF